MNHQEETMPTVQHEERAQAIKKVLTQKTHSKYQTMN